MNKIIFNGRLGRDIELKTANSGLELANFSVAVDRRAKKGEEKVTDWIPCTAFGRTAVFINTYFHKGDGITVSGRLESHSYDKNGEKRTSWAVTVEDVEFPIGGKSSGQAATTPTASSVPAAVETTEDLPF